MGMTDALRGTANKSGLAQKSSVDFNYLDPSKMGYDPAKLNPGDSAGDGKVWRHEFVEGGGGGWYTDDAPGQNKVSLPNDEAAPAAPGGGGGAGTPVDTAGLSAAMAGLRSAAAPPPPPGMMESLSAPGAANPALGQRQPPISMRQLAMMLPRIY